MRYSTVINKIAFLSFIILCLIFNNKLSGEIPVDQIAQLPDYPITRITPITLLPITQSTNNQDEISSYLPVKGEIKEWHPVGSAEKAIGEDLFLLIDGGAEIYHEYGFRQVIMLEYQNQNEKSINLEVYEMNDPSCAFGIYTFKTSTRGKELPFGNATMLEDYYLNLWKGRFLVTLIGFDSGQETIAGLITIARAIDAKIKSSGQKPSLVNLLPDKNLIKLGIKYLKGNLALFNSYEFGSGDIFGLKQGLIGDYDKYKVFIFKYNDKYESEKWFDNARNRIKSDARFDVYDMPLYSDYSEFGRKQDQIFMKFYENFIIIVVGTATTDGNKIIREVISKIQK